MRREPLSWMRNLRNAPDAPIHVFGVGSFRTQPMYRQNCSVEIAIVGNLADVQLHVVEDKHTCWHNEMIRSWKCSLKGDIPSIRAFFTSFSAECLPMYASVVTQLLPRWKSTFVEIQRRFIRKKSFRMTKPVLREMTKGDTLFGTPIVPMNSKDVASVTF